MSSAEPVRGLRALLAVQAGLCYVAILFASGDIWPTITLGFTFRLSQVCLLAAAALCPVILWREGVRAVPGAYWLCLFALWLFASLPFSLFVTRSIGYTFWAVTDMLTLFVFVQTFRTEGSLVRLVSCFLLSFIVAALFGIAQFVCGLFGIGLLVTQWWIPGVLPRINGISYEPSFYATYLLCGWVLSCYLLERRAIVPSRRMQRVCALSTTIALMLATSRLGWGMMLLWLAFRAGRWALLTMAGERLPRRVAAGIVALPLVVGGLLVLAVPFWPRVAQVTRDASFLISGLGVLGAPAHSAAIRAGDVEATWHAFTDHPLMGTGIGAVPVEIAAERGNPMQTLEDAKPNEGMSIFIEVLASTGIIGVVLLAGFAGAIVRAYHRCVPRLPPWRAEMLRGVAWSLLWVLIALQFSQNILRVWLFIDVAVLICCLTASPRGAVPETRRDLRPPACW